LKGAIIMIDEQKQKELNSFRYWYKGGNSNGLTDKFVQQSIKDVILESAESTFNIEIEESDRV
jgi:hypothetical protein